MLPLPIYVDIDGTLTEDGSRGWAEPVKKRIDRVKAYIEQGQELIVWSARGSDYAREFCEKHGIRPTLAIGKPFMCVDDNPTIRPTMRVVDPGYLEL